jgi:hypothetical protein
VINLVYINGIHIDNLSALAAGLVILLILAVIVIVISAAGYLMLTTWLKTRHMNNSPVKEE